MSFGDHLEELRRRIIFALLGFAAALVLCFNFGGVIIETLTAPYSVAMHELGYDPRMVQLNPIESFVEYVKITMEFALVLAAPWMLYQVWRFVAVGLYDSERRIVRLFAPTSIFLFVLGASFMVVVVLGGLLKFLIGISMWFPLPGPDNALYRWLQKPPPAVTASSGVPTSGAASADGDAAAGRLTDRSPIATPMNLPVLTEDPSDPGDGDVWINRRTRRLIARYDGENYYAPLQPASRQQFVQPFFSIAEYLGFVVNLALAFGLGFQIPIVVVFLITLGILPSAQVASARRYVLLGVAVFAAVLTPTPDVATMLFLAVPMYLLFEAGLLVGRAMERKNGEHATESDG